MTIISPDMNLELILKHMGTQATSLQEAELMREVLAARHNGAALEALSEQDWLTAQGQMELLKTNTQSMGGNVTTSDDANNNA